MSPASRGANGQPPQRLSRSPLTKRAGEVLVALAALVATVLMVGGCGQPAGPQLFPVRGSVTLDEKPLSFGAVRFTSEDGRLAKGKIQSDGTYSLSTSQGQDGVLPGSYQVSLQVREIKAATGGVPAMPGPSLIPKKYEEPTTSGLQFEVVPGENQYDIEIFSKS